MTSGGIQLVGDVRRNDSSYEMPHAQPRRMCTINIARASFAEGRARTSSNCQE
jgi:hypothetical protein